MATCIKTPNALRSLAGNKPKKSGSAYTAIKTAAPEVKPKSAAASAPIKNCITPTISVTASGDSMANSASELALVGPDMTFQLEPNSAAMMQGMTTVYNPYFGGKPASVANAKPCGNTSTAPSSPASASARSVMGVTVGVQSPNRRCQMLMLRVLDSHCMGFSLTRVQTLSSRA